MMHPPACPRCGTLLSELRLCRSPQTSLPCSACLSLVLEFQASDPAVLRSLFRRHLPEQVRDTDLKRLPAFLQLPPDWNPHHSLVIIGESGRGKTRCLWHALEEAAALGLKCKFRTHAGMILDFNEAQSRGALSQVMRSLAQADILAIDDLGNASSTDTQAFRLLDLLDQRYRDKKPIWVTSQYPGELWDRQLGERGYPIIRRLVESATILTQWPKTKKETPS